MKIKSGFIVRSVGGNRMVVATGERSRQFGGMIRLNESGNFLWNCLKEDVDSATLVKALLEEYDVNETTAKADVEGFLNTLRTAGVLDE